MKYSLLFMLLSGPLFSQGITLYPAPGVRANIPIDRVGKVCEPRDAAVALMFFWNEEHESLWLQNIALDSAQMEKLARIIGDSMIAISHWSYEDLPNGKRKLDSFGLGFAYERGRFSVGPKPPIIYVRRRLEWALRQI